MKRASRDGHEALGAIALAFVVAFAAGPVVAGRPSAQVYRLVGGSSLVDSCPVCGRPDIIRPMHGSLRLRLVDETPIERRFAVETLRFATDDGLYTGSGGGTFALRLVGPAELQQWEIEATVLHGEVTTPGTFREVDPARRSPFPMLDAVLEQTNGTPTRVYRLILEAAPVAEIWFSTGSGFTPGAGGEYVRGGALLSGDGHIVRTNGELLGAFGVEGGGGLEAGLDAIDVLPGGRVVFSTDRDVEGASVGTLHHGDLLLEEGRILRTFEELLAPFAVQPPVPDLGLDAVQVLDTGEILFSIEDAAFSEALGIRLDRGDLLSSEGRVVRSQKELLAGFHPAAGTPGEVGLDAVHLWPHGETWFSVEQGFTDEVLGPVLPGDLLSDRGNILFRNLDLMLPFMPLEDLADFGLDALFLVTPGTATPPAIAIDLDPDSGDVMLGWEGGGRVFQLERTENLTGPFEALTPITTDRRFRDPLAAATRRRAFYRLLQW